ncbi:BadF/BadG/BcrA/BcrD ATPase family protein [Rheinheimera sp.]|jgi:glucosamine kinase|uniref:BadF/BadG/BcrA/BcrD ATPase family protein n=1 Tax=Rheinheimera sp. TaxID=1869214 RepID=UPI002610EAE0|nr:BadF/BadG/BcrA/BcrD ATPase family protein [Rheinheimera sp.]MCA1931072.1 ATPase [Rheinheimera sp.]
MQQIALQHEQLFIGVDGGGTKCKARLESRSGALLAEAVTGPANPATDFTLAVDSILQACEQVLQQAGYPITALACCHVVMGLAGVNVPRIHSQMQNWSHPFASLTVTTDLHIACLGAHAGREGAILITGTGTAAFSIVDKKQSYFSAQGFPLGDRSSGAWFGWQAVCATLDSLDGLTNETELTNTICRALGVRSNTDLISCCLSYKATDYAQLAPLVLRFQQLGDPLALDITKRGMDYIQALFLRLLKTGAGRVAMLGGLAPFLADLLPEELKQHLSPVLGPPEVGAVTLARQLFTEKSA